jgi:hypothetical protein
MGYYLLPDGIFEFYGWPFLPFVANRRPTNGFALNDFAALTNLDSDVLEARRSLDD